MATRSRGYISVDGCLRGMRLEESLDFGKLTLVLFSAREECDG